MANQYVRQNVGGIIITALQTLGGTATRDQIKEEIVNDEKNDISYDDVYEPVTSRNGNLYMKRLMK